MQKTILLGLPAVYYIGELMKENLEHEGFKVIDISFQYADFRYKNIFQRTYNFFRKTVLRDKSYKNKLRFVAYEASLMQKLSLLEGKVDFAFIIRPDTYSMKVIKAIKEKTHKLIGYQWDGLKRFPWVKNYIPYFDRFFVFDMEDMKSKEHDLRYLTNFYFELPRLMQPVEEIKSLIYFLGAYNRQRMPMLEKIVEKSNTLNIEANIILSSRRRIQPSSHLSNIKITNKKYSFEENIDMVKKSTILIDIPVKIHNGLSFRMFEALCFEKKVITNNPSVSNYDFYKPNNIFIMGIDDENRLQTFLDSPYEKINPEIKRKYGFSNWIHYVLDMKPFTVIDRPDIDI